jgi:pimeloyl-ACP methyl ester carboxylesterase
MLAAAFAACSQAPTVPVAAVAEGYVTVDDGTKLYYRSVGEGPEVVVIPVALYVEDLLLPLAKGRRVIFYDPRNRGRSDAAELDSVSLERQVADLEALRGSLGIDRMALLGWSGLGMEMAVYTLRFPQRVTRLIQVSPVPPAASIMDEFGDTRGDDTDRAALDELDRQSEQGAFVDRPDTFCRLYNALTLPGNFVDDALAAKVPDVCIYENEWPVNLWPYFQALLPSFGDYDWRDELAALRVPRLIIHGREDGIPLEGARAWAAGFDQARLLVLSPAGHFPFVEQPDAFFRAAEAFLAGEWPEGAVAVAPPQSQ